MPLDPYEILTLDCSTRKTLELIGDKWSVLVLHGLTGKTRRYGELKTIVHGVTHKMLTQTLRRLENDGLVERTVYPVIPPHVEYRLTPLGESLGRVLSALCDWGDRHFQEVENARRAASEDANLTVSAQ